MTFVVVAFSAVIVAAQRRPRFHGHCAPRCGCAFTANIANKILVVSEKYVYCDQRNSSCKRRLSIAAACVSVLQWLLPQIILVGCTVVSVLHAQNGPTPNRRIGFIKFSRISESNAFVYIYAYTCTYIS